MPTCEICGHTKFTLVSTRIREGEGKIVQCSNCGLVIQDLDWNDAQIKNYYQNVYQETNSLKTGQIQTPQENFDDRIKTIDAVFNNVSSILDPDMSVLEVGCGSGVLLSRIKPLVKRCVGIELYPPFVEFIKTKLGIDAYCDDVNKLKLKEKFDLVTCIDTLDHLPNPLETLVTMKKLLSPSGKIYIEIPNRNEALNFFIPSPNREKFNEFFWHRAHIFYFTRDTITGLFKKAGLSIKVTSRHDYTLKNFLQWYFIGKPQSSFVLGTTQFGLFEGNSDFEVRMNTLFQKIEKEFKKIMAETFRGEHLCCIGEIEKNNPPGHILE